MIELITLNIKLCLTLIPSDQLWAQFTGSGWDARLRYRPPRNIDIIIGGN